ncbi:MULTISPECIES: glycosyltransferase 61 family protein [unclassified Synechococcus]|uniref:glycosyltransferase 61 family protein n=1 Tax=unclassified Synechococcus TaxID=2626047 RepID=UPI00140B4BF6|nr:MULTISPECIES: glycosyltransferase 61 family protein [unclassified Synechococcus]
MTLLDNYLITDQSYWLRFYPFLKLIDNKGINYAQVSEQFKNIAEINNLGEKNITTIAHNNHFGHFLLDDYPKIILDDLQFPSYIQGSFKLFNLSRGINDLLVSTLSARSTYKSVVSELNRHNIVESDNILQSFISNPIVNSFIIEQKFNSIRIKMPKETNKNYRIYLARSGKYESRIKNRKEILELLNRYDFFICDPSQYTSIELIKELSSASIIVTEAGTSCLVASLYAPKTAKIVALVPQELITNPKEDMIISGLPYHLASPQNIKFILGKVVDMHQIQSSQTCLYSPRDIEKEIA